MSLFLMSCGSQIAIKGLPTGINISGEKVEESYQMTNRPLPRSPVPVET